MSFSQNPRQSYSKIHPQQTPQEDYMQYYQEGLSDNNSHYPNQLSSENNSSVQKLTPQDTQIVPTKGNLIAVSEAFVIFYFG